MKHFFGSFVGRNGDDRELKERANKNFNVWLFYCVAFSFVFLQNMTCRSHWNTHAHSVRKFFLFPKDFCFSADVDTSASATRMKKSRWRSLSLTLDLISNEFLLMTIQIQFTICRRSLTWLGDVVLICDTITERTKANSWQLNPTIHNKDDNDVVLLSSHCEKNADHQQNSCH